MNLNHLSSTDDLKKLLAEADDDAGNHSLWVDKTGEVRVTLIPQNLTPVGFQERTPSMLLRYETFGRGNDYVGAGAAIDESHVNRLYKSLIKEWQETSNTNQVRFIDTF